MEYRPRRKSEALDDLVAKLEAMSNQHPDRRTLVTAEMSAADEKADGAGTVC
jgi:hypothetical protein